MADIPDETGHKVSFSDSSKSSHERGLSNASSSRSSSPRPQTPATKSNIRNTIFINRQSEALAQYANIPTLRSSVLITHH